VTDPSVDPARELSLSKWNQMSVKDVCYGEFSQTLGRAEQAAPEDSWTFTFLYRGIVCPSYLHIRCSNFPPGIWQQPGCSAAKAQRAVGKGRKYSASSWAPGPSSTCCAISLPEPHLLLYVQIWEMGIIVVPATLM